MSPNPGGRCRFCGCTEEAACEGMCAWTNPTRTVCSHCEVAARLGVAIVSSVAPLSMPSLKPAEGAALVQATREALELWLGGPRRDLLDMRDQAQGVIAALAKIDLATVERWQQGEGTLADLVEIFVQGKHRRVVIVG